MEEKKDEGEGRERGGKRGRKSCSWISRRGPEWVAAEVLFQEYFIWQNHNLDSCRSNENQPRELQVLYYYKFTLLILIQQRSEECSKSIWRASLTLAYL